MRLEEGQEGLQLQHALVMALLLEEPQQWEDRLLLLLVRATAAGSESSSRAVAVAGLALSAGPQQGPTERLAEPDFPAPFLTALRQFSVVAEAAGQPLRALVERLATAAEARERIPAKRQRMQLRIPAAALAEARRQQATVDQALSLFKYARYK